MSDVPDIQQALAPLVRSMDKLEQQYERVIVRIDQMPAVFMTRTEYEARHRELERRLDEQAEDNKSLKQQLEQRNQATRVLWISVIIAIVTSLATLVAPFLK